MPAKDKKRIKPVIEEVVEEAPVTAPETFLPKEEVLEADAPEPVAHDSDHASHKQNNESNKVNLKLVIIITLVSALVAAFVSGGVYVYLSGLEDMDQKQDSENEIVLAPDPSPLATTSPAPAPEEEFDVSEYSVQVLNGSGVSGAASKGEGILTTGGFNVDGIGNAANSNFTKTIIQMKKEVPAKLASQIKDTLEAEGYEVETGDSLAASSAYDVVVTMGAAN